MKNDIVLGLVMGLIIGIKLTLYYWRKSDNK